MDIFRTTKLKITKSKALKVGGWIAGITLAAVAVGAVVYLIVKGQKKKYDKPAVPAVPASVPAIPSGHTTGRHKVKSFKPDGKAHELSAADLDALKESGAPAVVLYYMPSCPACKDIWPKYLAAADTARSTYFGTIRHDAHSDPVETYPAIYRFEAGLFDVFAQPRGTANLVNFARKSLVNQPMPPYAQ